jgi:hypothetical protein
VIRSNSFITVTFSSLGDFTCLHYFKLFRCLNTFEYLEDCKFFFIKLTNLGVKGGIETVDSA